MELLNRIKRTAQWKDILYFGILSFLLLAVFLFSHGLEISHSEIIICFVVFVCILFLLGVRMWTNIAIHKFAVVFLLVAGMLMVFIQPILNAPDETVHFARAEMISRGEVVVDCSVNEYDIIQSVQALQINAKRTYLGSDIRGKSIDYSLTKTGHVAASNASIMYFPQAIGILIAKILQLDMIWMLWLARMMNLVFYSLGIGLAIKIAPKLKMTLLLVASLPMSIHQAGSCSPDAFINMTAILLIAFFLYLYFGEQKQITWKHVLIYWGICVFVTISKMTNLFLAGLILLIPRDKFKSVRQNVIGKVFSVLCAVACAGLYYWYTTRFPSSQEHMVYLQESNVNSVEQVKYIIFNFPRWFHDFGTALFDNAGTYVSMLSTFGWLEYSIPFLPVVTVVLFAKVCLQEKGMQLSIVNKILVFLMVIGVYVFTCLAMYISWTPVGSTIILGVQGRYFIPMIALSSLLFVPSNTNEVLKTKLGDMVAIFVLNGAMLITTAIRYY